MFTFMVTAHEAEMFLSILQMETPACLGEVLLPTGGQPGLQTQAHQAPALCRSGAVWTSWFCVPHPLCSWRGGACPGVWTRSLRRGDVAEAWGMQACGHMWTERTRALWLPCPGQLMLLEWMSQTQVWGFPVSSHLAESPVY